MLHFDEAHAGIVGDQPPPVDGVSSTASLTAITSMATPRCAGAVADAP
jgi:hypothetical protein